MPEIKQDQLMPASALFGTVIAGVACARWMPFDWFLCVLGYGILISLILGVFATVDSKNERRPPAPVALMLEALWLPSRNADIKPGRVLWAFFCVAGYVAGMLAYALSLPFFS